MKVAIYGFGNIGKLLAEKCVEVGFEIVSVVDVREDLIGRSLRSFGIDCDVKIGRELESGGEIAFVLTGSYLDRVYGQIIDCIEKGYNVVSTCETLAYPWYRYPELSAEIDRAAKKRGVTVLGTGINPGFLLDTLPVILSAPSIRVEYVKAVRKVDASKRRESFKRKIGLGLTLSEYESGMFTGHVGYAESALLIADALGFKAKRVVEEQRPIVFGGRVRGVRGYASITDGRTERVRVEFEAVEGGEEYEEVEVRGDNSVKWRSTGVNGDLGTVAILIKVSGKVLESRPGLIKMTDLIPFSNIRIPL